jgi:hypothetical protein
MKNCKKNNPLMPIKLQFTRRGGCLLLMGRKQNLHGSYKKNTILCVKKKIREILKTLSRGLHFDETYRPENQKKKRASCETLLFTDL